MAALGEGDRTTASSCRWSGDTDGPELIDCVELCRRGVPLCRVKNGQLKRSRPVTIGDQWLCYHSGRFWKILPRKLKSVDVNSIVEVRKGFCTDNLHQAAKDYAFREKASADMCFSVVIASSHIWRSKLLDFVATSSDNRDCVVAVLQHFIEQNSIRRMQFDEQRWLDEHFKRADTNRSGKLSFEEVWKLLKKLNLGISEQYARALFKEVDSVVTDHQLDHKEFAELFARLTDRTDLLHALRMFSTNNEPVLTAEELRHFLKNEQQFDEIDEKKVLSIINTFESLNAGKKVLGPIGFRRLLLARWGSIMKPEHGTVYQDMNQTLSHYYINTSHNTYLAGLQVHGEATVEGYINALKLGARFLELDVFDGEEGEPCITHKRTLIKAISLKNALKAIDDYAFKNNPYPVILTIENHVGFAQQKAMARIFIEVFGEKIYRRSENGPNQPLPSPNALKHMYLLRGKNSGSLTQQSDEATNENGDRTSATVKETSELHPDYSALISLPSVKLTTNIYQDIDDHPLDGSASLSESKVLSFYDGGSSLMAYTSNRLVKSFPKGLRQDSSNMDPLPSWICGVQSVAMNMQTPGEYLDLVNGLFRVNGNCGYVLKPDALIRGIDPRSLDASVKPMSLAVGVISAQYLPKTNQSTNDVIDPYVSIEILGIPTDCRKFKTKVVRNNGFNPQFNETFIFSLNFPDFALLRVCVKDFDLTSANDFVGEYTIPVSSIRPGYSHIQLNTGPSHTPDECASIFVRIAFE